MSTDIQQNKTYYDLLGVSRSASTEEIKQAFRRIAKSHHPDSQSDTEIVDLRGLDLSKTRAFKMITFAYHTLTDEGLRKEYDKLLPPVIEEWEDDSKEQDLAPRMGNLNSGSLVGKFGVIPEDASTIEESNDKTNHKPSFIQYIINLLIGAVK